MQELGVIVRAGSKEITGRGVETVYKTASSEPRRFLEWIPEDPQRIDLKARCGYQTDVSTTSRCDKPGEPENSDNAGITVFGGTMVLSAIFAQSLIIVNFP